MKQGLFTTALFMATIGLHAQTDFQAGLNKISFKSDGFKLIGHIYLPPSFVQSGSYTAVVIDGPQSSVKEQVAANYASHLAEAGFVVLAFDHQGYGESEGFPRQDEVPQKKVRDIQNAVSYLISLPFVDSNKIGAIGICSGGGYSARAVAGDPRVKAFVGIAGFYHNPAVMVQWLGEDGYKTLLNRAISSRQNYRQTGEVEYMVNVSDKGGDLAMPGQEAFDYYGTKRSYSPGWVNRSTTMSFEHFLQFNAIDAAQELSVPTLIIHSDNALVPEEGAKTFYRNLKGKKDLYWMSSINHIAFYDQADLVKEAAVKTIEWFEKNLR
ncbi:MAG TPA: alpha/beta hydrolase [Flavisolibacter sp.]|nr:alpha/beta hydrolase [Flavisolibacter sp.]